MTPKEVLTEDQERALAEIIRRAEEQPVHIYRLRDPRDGRVRYVGKTVRPIRQRFSDHIHNATVRREETHVCRWLRTVIAAGLEPTVELIEIAGADWADRERYWIAEYRRQGVGLTNSTDGGEGVCGMVHSAEARARMRASQAMRPPPSEATLAKRAAAMRGKLLSEDAKRKIGDAARARFQDPANRKRIGAAYNRSEEAMNNRRLAQQRRDPATRANAHHAARNPTPEQRERLSAAQRGKKASAETRAKLSIIHRRRWAGIRMRKQFNAAAAITRPRDAVILLGV